MLRTFLFDFKILLQDSKEIGVITEIIVSLIILELFFLSRQWN